MKHLSYVGIEELRTIPRPLVEAQNVTNLEDIPSWVLEFVDSYGTDYLSNKYWRQVEKISEEQRLVCLLSVIRPIICQACDKLEARIDRIIQKKPEDLPFDPLTIVNTLLSILLPRLTRTVARSMVLELNIARTKGILDGNTSDRRFQSFIDYISQQAVSQRILTEYPVLIRQLMIRIDTWIKFSLEFLDHLCSDWETIKSYFSPEKDIGLISQLERVGDIHRDGRFVMIVRFSSNQLLVYKPRSLSVDFHFNELLNWLNDKGFSPHFRRFKMLNRSGYGWTEYVPKKDCSSPDEIENYYLRIGGYLALLYALGATDLHSENLIANGQFPVLVDVETLFHPTIRTPTSDEYTELASAFISSSVLKTSLLPRPGRRSREPELIDLSGLSNVEGKTSPFLTPNYEEIGTDEMRFGWKRISIKGLKNYPTFKGSNINLSDYARFVETGFKNMYNLLLCNYEALVKDGPMNDFSQDEVRVILRSTRTYNRLIVESVHPYVLNDAIQRDIVFATLWKSAEDQPYLSQVVEDEIISLRKGDIPIFTTVPDSRDLHTATGKKVINFLNNSVQSKDIATWIGLSEVHNKWAFKPVDLNLYNGLLGIALFLAYVGKVLNEERFTNLAKKTINNFCYTVDRNLLTSKGIGGFTGVGGMIYALAHSGSMWNMPELITYAEDIVALIPKLIKNDVQFDVIGGAAGCIKSLLTLYQVSPSEMTLRTAVMCGDWLVKNARKMKVGVGWINPFFGTPLTGFSHGAAGIGCSLIHLSSISGIDIFSQVSRQALEYERHLFSPANSNWPDLRNTVQTDPNILPFHVDWCHGAPGIGLSRLSITKFLNDGTIQSEIVAALKTTIAKGFGRNHSLCHGDFGNLEFLIEAALLNYKKSTRDMRRIGLAICYDITKRGYRCGNLIGAETPGLMTGLAGIGFGLLRFAKPDVIPSILLLEPPANI